MRIRSPVEPVVIAASRAIREIPRALPEDLYTGFARPAACGGKAHRAEVRSAGSLDSHNIYYGTAHCREPGQPLATVANPGASSVVGIGRTGSMVFVYRAAIVALATFV